ncbi:toll/interleukin-1 receptor domain-containing protein [Paracidobacterium acidisoli]|uniref:Toll/interleukin-1 receptor domain-containing protein n=1 Tax=Paracidobacterium acidisoli TaxID=2303751 RepID=A0A372IMC5_9BACT|nr:toll/interleukin-1 receptor domain-containing protein [Paracidobacterium acidisoli]
MGRAIFISYRRDDTEGEAGRLFDDLVRTFGDDSVFMDVAGINPGIDFRKAIDDGVAACGVLLAMIGPTWATITGSTGQCRLDDPNDFVRLEIASALARNIAVIPVLVHDAKMPHPDQLPDNLKDLAYRNSVEITHARWNSDVQLLTKALAPYVSASGYTNTEPVHATVPVQLPPPHVRAQQAAPAKSSKLPMLAGVGIIVAVLIAAGIFYVTSHHSPAASPAAASAAQTTPAVPVTDASSTPSAQPAAADPLAGTWTNPSSKIRENMPRQLEISGTGSQLSFHMWGACSSCDWGSQPASSNGQSDSQTWTATFNFPQPLADDPPGRVTTVTVTPAGNVLHLLVASTFPDHRHIQGKWTLVRAQ